MTTLRIAHLADSHFDEKNRLDDNVAVHKAFVEQARAAGVDLILHAGDFFERRSTPAERNALAEFLTEAAEIADVVGVKGNHDADDDLDVFNRLDTRNPVEILSRPGVATRGGHAIALPWFTKAGVVAGLAADTPIADSNEATISAARRLLAILRIEADRIANAGAVPLLVGHVLVAGSETSTGQTLIGSTVELAPSDILEVGCAYAALGHIHKAQSWLDGRVAYSGSPQRMNFGEPEPKGWNLVTIDTERWREPGGVSVQFCPLPAREIVLLEADWTAHEAVHTSAPHAAGILPGALVRFRYRIRPEHLHMVDEGRITDGLLNAGAHSVKLEAVLVHQDRIRCTEIATAADTWAKCLAYWQAKGIDVPENTRERLRLKLEEIETRERAEVAA